MRAALGRILVCLVLFPLPALAQSEAPIERLVGRRISEVRLILDGRPTTAVEISRVLETEAGAPLSTSQVRESIIHLMALTRFEDVRVRAEADGQGVRLVYDLVPLRTVKGVEFQGDVALSRRLLRSELTERYGTAPAAVRVAEMARVLESVYHDRGYLAASIKPRVEAPPGAAHTTLVFDVAAGERALIGNVEMHGAPGGAITPVLQRLGIQSGAPFNLVALRQRVNSYLADLRSRGYFEAKLDVEPVYSEDRRRVSLLLRMDRGPHVKLAFRGDPLPATRKNELDVIRREGAVDEDMLENEQRSLETELRRQGFRDAEVPYTREVVGPDEVEIVFTVKRGPQYRVARVEVAGNQHLPRAALQPLLRLVPGDWFVNSRLEADLATLRERYRRDGFKDVKVEASVAAEPGAQASLRVVYAVTEGPRTQVTAVEFTGNTSLGTETLRRQVRSRPGAVYYEPTVSSDRDTVLLEYLNRGYQLVSVDLQTTFTTDKTGVALRFVIVEGPRIRVDHVLVVGNVRTKAATIEREVGLRRGAPLSTQDLAEAQARLNAMGLFRRVQVTELQHGSDTERDVLVIVEEAPPNTIGYGAGLEGARRLKTDEATQRAVERFDLAPRGFVEYGRRNLWGGNRSINLFARAAIRASDQLSSSSDSSDEDGSGFREYRLLATYREPKLLGSGIDLAVTAIAEQAIRSSFDFRRRETIVEGTHRFSRTVSLAGRYSLGRTRLFNERIAAEDQLPIDRVYRPGVLLSSFSTSITRNTRDDQADPTRGSLLLLDGTLAARALGSEVGFMKGTTQAFTYRQLPILRGAVLAAGARLGLATGFRQVTEEGTSLQDLPASERFFAGGDTTVRGFAQDRLGAVEVLDEKGVSKGGNALVILNGELRIPLVPSIGLGGATFIDIGNVFARVNDLNLAKLRSGIGFGIRWKSPVGPLRIDLAWKTSRRTFGNGTRESRFAPYISIGHPF